MSTPEAIPDKEIGTHLQLIDTDWTTSTVRPKTVLAALMQQGPGDPLQESLEELEPLHFAIEYAAQCLNDEETFILNAISFENVGFEELGRRLGVSRVHAWRLHTKAISRLRTLLLNHPPVRERLGMQPTWNAAAMQELVAIASYAEGWPSDMPPYATKDAVDDIDMAVTNAVTALNAGQERQAVTHLSFAAEYAVMYLRSVGKWNLLQHHELLCSKQNDYGHGNILKFGMTGVMVRASDKQERLKNLTSREGVAARNESLLDSFYDVIGYAVIARMLKAETFELELDTTEKED